MTDLVKADFEKWFEYYKNIEVYDLSIDVQYGEYVSLEDIWDNLPEAFKWGVWVDYFGGVGIYVDIFRTETAINGYHVDISDKKGISSFQKNGFTRPEARKAALEKASQIRNEQLKQAIEAL